MKNNVILVTNNGNITQKIQKSLVLLREKDCFLSTRSSNCFEVIKENQPSVVFYHYSPNKFNNNFQESENLINLLYKIKQNPLLKNTSVILLYENIDEETLCLFFEKGIADFLPVFASDTELTIRTIWCLQKKELLNKYESEKEILSQLKILDSTNNVFTENYIQKILNEESTKNWGTLVALAPDINVRNKISPSALMNSIKNIVRADDILGYASDFKIYLWFRETKSTDVLKILEKIKAMLTKNFPICAGYIEVNNIAFDIAEDIANRALSKALLKGNTFICGKNSDKKEFDDDSFITNYKLYKDTLSKKLESILLPLFFQTQKRIEQQLFETQINQSVNKENSLFILENETGKGVFNITYSGFTKIKIKQTIELKNKDTQQKNVFIESENITKEKIENILNLFINNFKNQTNA